MEKFLEEELVSDFGGFYLRGMGSMGLRRAMQLVIWDSIMAGSGFFLITLLSWFRRKTNLEVDSLVMYRNLPTLSRHSRRRSMLVPIRLSMRILMHPIVLLISMIPNFVNSQMYLWFLVLRSVIT